MSHDNTMSEADAAAYLGVTDRTVRNYIKKGLLSKVREGRTTKIPVEDVITLREDMHSSAPVVSRTELLQHKARIRRLESNMEVVLRMLDAKDAPLGINAEYAKGLYDMARENLHAGAWALDAINPWLDIFDRLSEDDLDTMATATMDAHPWRVFLRLCNAMIAHVVGTSDYVTSLEAQSLHRKLAASRRRLRITSFIFGEMQGSVASEITDIVETKTTADELFRKILKN